MNASDLIQEFAAAFNRQDVAGVLACFTEEAVYHDTFYGHNGTQPRRAALLSRHPRHFMWRGSHVVVADALRAAAEWTFSYTVSEAIPRSAGRKIRFSGMSLFELKGGKIASYREYFDSGAAFLQLGLAPGSLAKVLGRRLRP